MRKIIILIIISTTLFLSCGDGPSDKPGPIIIPSKISSIKFSSRWDPNDSILINPDTQFFFIDTVYYEVIFDTVLANCFMIKKVWERNDTLLFSSIVYIPIDSKRICGEMRHYNNDLLELGKYEISLYYYKADTTTYVPCRSEDSVKCYFWVK